ncbi:MAG: tRNA 2-selenouridine(34) synthase MnmH [Pseudomonadota bacterium]
MADVLLLRRWSRYVSSMFSLNHISDFASLECDAIIDVRSPSEFAHDHVPGAINLPVLNDDERAQVGRIYKQVSSFAARKTGAALVFRNAAAHIETQLADKPGGWRPLVYCWRGGQRSGAFSWMLNQIGWPAQTLSGGYKSFRRTIVDYIYDNALPLRIIRLAGHTGTGKTELLAKVRARGLQSIDLEALAQHRGSLLGGLDTGQPSQKAFETRLAFELQGLDPSRPVLVEAESSKIGEVALPPALWNAMKSSPIIEVTAPLDARAHYLARAYASVLENGAELKRKLEPLRRFRGHEVVDHWHALIDQGDRVALCQSLADRHYDPAYSKTHREQGVRPIATFNMHAVSPDALDRAARELVWEVQSISI